MKPFAHGWVDRIAESYKAKKAFTSVARQCEQFFSADVGFMWKEDFQKEFMGGKVAPKFKITIAKAFELVAIIGPALYWKYPKRVVRNYPRFDLAPELFGDPQDQQAMQVYQQVVAEVDAEDKVNSVRNSLMERYLDYSQREQPGTLSLHSELAITEALLTGRGCLWVEPYQFPDSKRSLTGCFYDTVHNLFVDPDCTDPTLHEAKWIARRHVTPWWELEDRFKLKRGTLREKGSIESAEGQSTTNPEKDMYRRAGKTFDLIVWYEVWSKGGIGTRMTGVTSNLAEKFDDVLGNHVYVCVAKGVDFPLNAPTERLREATDDEVRQMFDWPCPYYKDDRWPVALLDFYRKPRSAWPLAPLAMGLGELMFLNVMISVLCDRAYATSRNIIAYFKSAAEQLQADFRSGKHEVFIEINDTFQKSVSDLVQFVQQPAINYDVFRMLETVSDMFDKRVGLTDLVYGLNPGGVASRSATDISAKQENLSIRPEYMAGKVEQWQSEAANLEKFAARWHVESDDIQPLLGRVGATLWDQLITSEDPEIVVRDMKAMVEAGSVRRPNRQRDAANLQQLAGYLVPEFSKHADVTGDTSQINAFFESLGRSIDQDTQGWMMSERVPAQPPVPPEVQQQQQMAMQMEAAKLQAEVETKQLEVQRKTLEVQEKQSEVESKGQVDEAEMIRIQMQLEGDSAQQTQSLSFADDQHAQDLAHSQDIHSLEMRQMMQEQALKLDSAREMAKVKVETAKAAGAVAAKNRAKQGAGK